MDALAAEHGMNRSQYLRFCFERQRAAALRAKKRNKKEK